LDVMLPKIDGFELLRRLRGAGIHTPVLMLTARADLEDRVKGLDFGADYYLTKPSRWRNSPPASAPSCGVAATSCPKR
jgi:DNA-binding response OmpR family regulator